jgi:type VI secretion system protein ImpJ
MSWNNKIVWTEGMFLQPQHFQQHDRHVESQLRSRFGASLSYGWGFTSLTIDEPALAMGKLVIVSASGVMPDGCAFHFPANDSPPPALDIAQDVRNEVVVLALAMQQQGRIETNAEETPGPPGPRYNVAEIEVADSNASAAREAPVQIGRVNLRLMLARDSSEAFATLGVARIVERRADNRISLDAQYIPPMLHAPAQPVLDGYLRELHGMVRQRADALAARLSQPGRSGVGEIVDFLLLEAVNREEPLLAHLRRVSLLHPERLYTTFIGLAGDLATFRDKRRPADFPEYQHDDLAKTFRPVIESLRQSLSTVLEQNAIPIELQERKHGIRVAMITDAELRRSASFVLAVNAQIPSETLRQRFPAQIKIGPGELIRDLVQRQLPGIGIRAMPVAPRQIPFHAGFSYFELDTQHNEVWKQLETSGMLAMHVAGEFPGLEMEFWAVRG